MRSLIIPHFNPQPKAIADTGCGDGSLLKRLYDVILKETLRGQNISEYPLSLVGIDYNQSALDETTKTLDGYPHHALQGDIGDPAQLLKDIEALDFSKDDILHVRSFLDHDRPYQAPEADDYSYHVSEDGSGVYVRSDGSLIDSKDMMQSTVEHFRRWQQVVGRHGMINLEVHTLDPKTVHAYLDNTENLHFDAYHAFSSQYLMKAEQMIQAAAGGGLWSERSQCMKYPKTLGYARISLHRFIPQEVSLRHVTLSDVPDLMAIEQACWPKALRSTKSQIKTRIKQYPQGQWGLVQGQELVGVLYTQKISDPLVLKTALFKSVESLHEKDGKYLQLISLNVLPEYQQQGLGDLLRQQALLQASLDSITLKVTGVTRCVGFDPALGDYADYIKQEDAQGLSKDSLLAFHVSRGASIVGVVENYRQSDEKNQGCGVLIEYELSNQKSKLKARAVYSPSKEGSLELKIKDMLEQALGEKRLSNYQKDTALLDLGLDSMVLMKFKLLLEEYFVCQLETGFFFKYRSIVKISDYFEIQNNRFEQSQFTEQSLLHSVDRESDHENDIAIVGCSVELPGEIDDLESFWECLANNRCVISDLSQDRESLWSQYSDSNTWSDKIRHGGFIEDVAGFDAQFFSIAPREAECMDPQQRILLQNHWRALEHANLSPKRLQGSNTALYVGIFSHDYEALQTKLGVSSKDSAYLGTGGSESVAAGRIAYSLDFRGPAMAVNTACSSSLVALHLACQALRHGETDLALASGVNLMLTPQLSQTFNEAGMYRLMEDVRPLMPVPTVMCARKVVRWWF